jgi:hypothetical protein
MSSPEPSPDLSAASGPSFYSKHRNWLRVVFTASLVVLCLALGYFSLFKHNDTTACTGGPGAVCATAPGGGGLSLPDFGGLVDAIVKYLGQFSGLVLALTGALIAIGKLRDAVRGLRGKKAQSSSP